MPLAFWGCNRHKKAVMDVSYRLVLGGMGRQEGAGDIRVGPRCCVAHANRCGEETVNGISMAGHLGTSMMCGPHGDVLVAARGEPHPTGLRYLEELRWDLCGWPQRVRQEIPRAERFR